MALCSQRHFLRALLALTAGAMQICGLWPFRFDRRAGGRFRRSRLLTAYSLCVLPAMLPLMLRMSRHVGVSRTLHLGHISAEAFTAFWSSVMWITLVATFATMLLGADSLAAQLQRTRRLAADIRQQRDRMYVYPPSPGRGAAAAAIDSETYTHSMWHYAGKTLLLGVAELAATCYHMSVITPDVFDDRLSVAVSIFAVCLVTIVPSVFYGCMLAVRYHYWLINWRLSGAVAALRRRVLASAGQDDDGDDDNVGTNAPSFARMQLCCELADRVDELAALHWRLTRCAQGLNRAVAVPLLLWSVYGTFSLVSKLFMMYVEIVLVLNRGGGGGTDDEVASEDVLAAAADARVREVVWNLLSVLVTLAELAGPAIVCAAAANEAARTSRVMHGVFVTPRVDVRLKRSVRFIGSEGGTDLFIQIIWFVSIGYLLLTQIELFSVQLLLNRLQTTTAGEMFTIDYTMIFSVVSAVSGYLIILIQFEINGQ